MYDKVSYLNSILQEKLNIENLYNKQAKLLIRKISYETLKKYNYNFTILKNGEQVVNNDLFLNYIDEITNFLYENIFLKEKLTIDTILQLHYEIVKPLKLEKINPDEIGTFRKHGMVFTGDMGGNRPRRRTLIKPKYIKGAMENLIRNINKKNDIDSILDFFIDSVLIIHPFDNGNGRTFHLILDVLLFKNKYFPLFAKKTAPSKLDRAYEKYNQTLSKSTFKKDLISIVEYIYSHYNIS